jgi:tripartite ATP-independent transporter DctP family solute receptor
MIKKLFVLLMVFGMVTLFSSLVSAASYKPEYKMSVAVGPQGPWGESAAKFAELVKERTQGRINIKPYYALQLAAGQQINEYFITVKGVADFAQGSTINWSPAVKELTIFSMPFFFPNYKALDAVQNGEPGRKIWQISEQKGVVCLAWGENGYRELTNSKRPVRKPEDMEGLKLRVPGTPIFIETFRALGANPMAINWGEALTAFQQGTVDGQENPIVSMLIPYKLWEVHKNITLWHYAIDPLLLGVNKDVWNTFTPQDQEIVAKAAQEAMVWNKKAARKGLEDSTEAIEFLKSKGMQVVTLTPSEVEAFKAKVKPVYDKWMKEIGPELVESAEKIAKGVSK